MFKPKSLEDFKKVQEVVTELNKQNFWSIRLEIKQEHSECDLYVIDDTENLYYDGPFYEKVMEALENALKEDTGDNEAFFDCDMPGRYLADFKSRSRYSDMDMFYAIKNAYYEALLSYMGDNNLEVKHNIALNNKINPIVRQLIEATKDSLQEKQKESE